MLLEVLVKKHMQKVLTEYVWKFFGSVFRHLADILLNTFWHEVTCYVFIWGAFSWFDLHLSDFLWSQDG